MFFKPSHLIASGERERDRAYAGESCILHPQQEEISHLISQSAFEHLSDQKQIKTNLNCNFFMIPLSMQLYEMVCHDIDYKAMIHAAYFSTGNSANCSFLLNVAIKVEVRVPPALVTVYSCVTQRNFM